MLWAGPTRAQQVVGSESLFTNLAFPAGIAFAADGTMYFTERGGRVRVATRGELAPEPLAEAETTTSGETGFLGIAVSPDGAVYVFATDPEGNGNSVLRVDADGGELETVLSGLPGGGYHNGGGLAFDDSGALFISNGEIHDSTRSQDPLALGGKVYRVSAAGEPLEDNPFGPDSMTYALGLRNPYGLAIDPVSGDPFVTENGPSSNDEVNHVLPGSNHGWPDIQGAIDDVGAADSRLEGRYRNPLLDYPDTIVPTGIAFADPQTARPRYAGDLFFGAYGERSIHRVRLDDARRVVSDDLFLQETDPVIAVAWGPRGLYYSTPSAIKVVPLAKGEPARPQGDAAVEGPEGTGLRAGRIFVALAVIVAGIVLLTVIRRARSGRPPVA